MIKTRQYKQEDAFEIVTEPEERAWALLNEVSGPGVTYEQDGKIISVAGIRVHGIGEIWGAFSDTAKSIKYTLLRESRMQLHKMMEESDLWLVIATVDNISDQQRRFLEALGFTKTECYTYRKG